MSWTYSEEYYKQYTRDTWNESAPHYRHLLRNLNQYTPPMLALAQVKPGERVLDVATGPGEPALTIAGAVGPSGSVLGIDLAERMVELAREQAKAQDRPNAEFRVMDAENLDLPDASFDLVVCRFGLQIVTDPDRAVAEAYRVLRPGGRIVATVWTGGEQNPHLHAVIGPMLEHAEPDENGYLPTPYEMGAPGELAGILQKAGFTKVREETHDRAATFASPQEYEEAFLKGSPVGHSLSEEPPEVQAEVLRKTRENVKRYTAADGTVRMPAQARVVLGVK